MAKKRECVMENLRCFSRVLCATTGLMVFASGASANVLANPGFESGLSGWTTFSAGFNLIPETTTPNSGTGVAKMFGQFSGGFNVSGLFQSFPATAGELWSFDAHFRHNTGDAMTGAGLPDFNWVVMKFEFRDAFDVVVPGGAVESVVLDGTSPTDTWLHAAPISLAAPAGTQSVFAFFLYLQPGTDGGAVLIDDANFIPAPGTAAGLLLAGGCLARRRRRV